MRAALALVVLATGCSAAPAAAPRPTPAPVVEGGPAPLSPARWAFFDRLGVLFDEAGHGSPLARPEPAIVDGVRVVVDAGVVVASARHAQRFSGFRSLPERLGGGFVLWSDDRVYVAKEFLAEPSPVADVGAPGGARPWLSSVLLRTSLGLLELDPRDVHRPLRRVALPGIVDALAFDAQRGVRVDAVGRASFTTDGGASWTDVLATRGVLVRSLAESAAGVVLDVEGAPNLVLGKHGGLGPPVEPPAPLPGEAHLATPSLAAFRPASSRALPGEILAQAIAAGALLPGGRIVVARDNGVRVLAAETGLPLADADLSGVDPRFSRCQAAPAGSPPVVLACTADTGAAVLDLDGSTVRLALEATFPAGGGGFIGGPRGRLAFDGRCGPEPPASTDLGSGTPKPAEPTDEAPQPAPVPDPAGPPELPPDDDARVCVRASTSRWVERRLRGDDARHLYRWVPGDDGSVTALVLAGHGDRGDAGADAAAAEPRAPDGGESPRLAPPEGVRVVRVDAADPALGGGAFPAVPPPQKENLRRAMDVDFWQDGEGAVRGWILLPPEGEEKVAAPTSAQGPAHRLLPVAVRRGGRVAGVRIDAAGQVTVYPLPKGTTEVVTGGRFALAMATAHAEPAIDGGTPPAPSTAGHAWFETVDGGASWTEIEGPPVGAIEPPGDESATFACSPIGCAWASGVVRLGWGGPRPTPLPELALAPAAGPRPREPELPSIACRIDGSPPWVSIVPGLPARAAAVAPVRVAPSPPTAKSAAAAKSAPTAKSAARKPGPPAKPEPAAPEPAVIALRVPTPAVGALREHTWTGEVLPPFQPGAAPRRLSVTDQALHAVLGSTVPILGAGPRAPVDLLLLVDKRRLRAGGGAASFLPFDGSGRFTVAADGPDGALALFDADRGTLWLSRGEVTAAVLRVLRVADVSRLRLTLARRAGAGALALAGYSSSSGEIVAGDLDLGRAAVGPLAVIGSLEGLAEAGACPHATHRLLVDFPLHLRIAGPMGEAFLDEQMTVSAILDAGPSGVCVEAVEAMVRRPAGGVGPVVLRATLGRGGSASLWSAQKTVRGTCSISPERGSGGLPHR